MELKRTNDGDYMLPEETTELLSKIEDQLTRLVQVMDSEALTVSSLYALSYVLNLKVHKIMRAAEQFVTAAVIQLEGELYQEGSDPFDTADHLDDKVQNLIKMYDDLAIGVSDDLSVEDFE